MLEYKDPMTSSKLKKGINVSQKFPRQKKVNDLSVVPTTTFFLKMQPKRVNPVAACRTLPFAVGDQTVHQHLVATHETSLHAGLVSFA